MSARLSSQEARAILDRAVQSVTGGSLPGLSMDLIQGVARFETGYGGKWDATGCPGADTSNNWGAVKNSGGRWATLAEAQCDPSKSFACQDRDSSGKTWWYCFRRYATPEDGAAHTVSVLWKNPYVRAYLLSGEGGVPEMAAAMKQGGYFEATVEAYTRGLAPNVSAIRSDLGSRSIIGPALVAGGAGLALMLGAWRFLR
jgi:hypothetical protein